MIRNLFCVVFVLFSYLISAQEIIVGKIINSENKIVKHKREEIFFIKSIDKSLYNKVSKYEEIFIINEQTYPKINNFVIIIFRNKFLDFSKD